MIHYHVWLVRVPGTVNTTTRLSIFLNLRLSSCWSFEQVRRISLFWILGQPLAWAFGYWMVSWRMYGCGNPFKLFFCQIFAPPFCHLSILTQVSVPLISGFWSFKPFDFCIHAFPALLHVLNSLVSSTYPWKFLKVNSSSLPHKFKLTPSQFAQRLPHFLSTFTTLYLSKLTWPTPSTIFSGLTPSPIYSPHTLCPLFLVFYCTFSIPLHYICMLVSTFLP